MTIGERIRERRKFLNMSVDDLAHKLNKNRATVYRYENDEIENLPITIIEPLASALDTTPAYLMGWEEMQGVILNEEHPEGKPVEGLYYKFYKEETGRPVFQIHLPENFKSEDLDELFIREDTINEINDILKMGAEIMVDGKESPLSAKPSESNVSPFLSDSEKERINKYRSLDEKGQHTVDTVLEMEYNRCNKTHLMPVAAHSDDDSPEELELMKEDLEDL